MLRRAGGPDIEAHARQYVARDDFQFKALAVSPAWIDAGPWLGVKRLDGAGVGLRHFMPSHPEVTMVTRWSPRSPGLAPARVM